MAFSRKLSLILVGFAIASAIATAQPPQEDLAAQFRDHARPLAFGDEEFNDSAAEFLRDATAEAQFVVLGEPHNLREVAQFTTTLFNALQDWHGYHYLAVETGPQIMDRVSTPPARSGHEALVELFKQYPYAFHFFTDQELDMMSAITGASDAAGPPIWGLDQVHSAVPVLDRLRELAMNEDIAQSIENGRFQVSLHNENRERGAKRFILTDTPLFRDLLHTFNPAEGSEAQFLFDQLLLSNRIYRNNIRAGEGALTGYDSNNEREQNMKTLFMRGYENAVAAGDAEPKVLAKLGHWHVMRGRSPGNAYTLGNFASEFARANGNEAFLINITIIRDNDRGFSIADEPAYAPLAAACNADRHTLVDLRPLRKRSHAGRLKGLAPKLREWLYRYDAVLVLANPKPGTYRTAVEAERRFD